MIANHLLTPICHTEQREVSSSTDKMQKILHNVQNDKSWFIFAFFLTFLPFLSSAQIVYDNRIYQPNIKTVEFYNTALEGSFPIITLGSAEQLLLGFDDLSTSSKSYSYTVEHCDAEWNVSRLSPVE